MKTANLSEGHEKSGRPENGRCLRQPETRAARILDTNASSVLLLPTPRTARMIRERSGEGSIGCSFLDFALGFMSPQSFTTLNNCRRFAPSDPPGFPHTTP